MEFVTFQQAFDMVARSHFRLAGALFQSQSKYLPSGVLH